MVFWGHCYKGSSSSRIPADLGSRSIRQMITLPETNSPPLKIGKRPQKETIVFLCHPFSDVNSLLVSGRLNQQPQPTRSLLRLSWSSCNQPCGHLYLVQIGGTDDTSHLGDCRCQCHGIWYLFRGQGRDEFCFLVKRWVKS